jgi:hypothetical protein
MIFGIEVSLAAYMTIKTTKLIKEGEERLLFYDMSTDASAIVEARDLVLLNNI